MDEFVSKKLLVAKFNELASKYIDGDKRQRGLAYTTAADMIALADAADVQPINQWISVKDRLPDESCECLGIVDGEVTEVSYSPKCKELICVWSMCDADGFKPLLDDAVTHWMPLPEPPKDGDTNEQK